MNHNYFTNDRNSIELKFASCLERREVYYYQLKISRAVRRVGSQKRSMDVATRGIIARTLLPVVDSANIVLTINKLITFDWSTSAVHIFCVCAVAVRPRVFSAFENLHSH